MSSEQHEEFNKKVNAALRRGRGTRVGPPTPEANQRLNSYIRRAAAAGTWEADAESGEVIARDGELLKDDE